MLMIPGMILRRPATVVMRALGASLARLLTSEVFVDPKLKNKIPSTEVAARKP